MVHNGLVARASDQDELPQSGQYASYMRTGDLLGLQPEHDRDELLFVSTHQATELLLKVASEAVTGAREELNAGVTSAAELLLRRACATVRAATGLLPMLSELTPQAFARLRPRLGNGSGAESPGWRQLRSAARELQQEFDQQCTVARVSLPELYRGQPDQPLYRLAERMVDLDEAVRLWRMQHVVLAQRVVGAAGVGTQGMPVATLAKSISKVLFPALWAVRDELTAHSELMS